jgi:Ca2+-binding EF-hand superfamily protein
MTQAAVNWKSSNFSVLVGLFVIFVGGLYIHTGISVSTKLTQLRESLQSPEAIKHAFMHADENGDGELDKAELMKLMAVLGTGMTEKEAETCLDVMDKPGPDGQKNGKLSLFEFMTFMERSDSSILF